MTYQKSEELKMGKEIQKVAAYLRVSSKRQEKQGNSLENQEDHVRQFAKEEGWELPDELIFIDSKPATKSKGKEIDRYDLAESYEDIRPSLTKLLIEAEKKSFDHLIVYNRDRLVRVVEEYLAIDVFLKRCGIGVTYLKEGEVCSYGNPAINRLLNVILSSIAELETNMLSTRVRDGNKTCAYKDWWPGGRTPFGYVGMKAPNDIKDKHSILKRSDFESKMVERVYELYLQGFGYKRISDVMDEEYGFIHWTKSKIRTIIGNKTYTGSVQWNRRGGRRNPKVNEQKDIMSSSKIKDNEIVADNDWERCFKIRKERDETKDAHILNTPFLLKNKLICAGCNKPMKTKNQGRNRSLIYYCGTPDCSNINNGHRVTIPKEIIEHEFNKKIVDILQIQDFETLQKRYDEIHSKKHNEYEEIISQLKNMIEKSKATMNKIDGRLSELHIDDEYIRKALETRRTVEGTAVEEYEKVLGMFEGKLDEGKIERYKLESIVEMLPRYLTTLDIDEENPKYGELVRYRRMFILFAIAEVKVDYDKDIGKMDVVIKCNFSQGM